MEGKELSSVVANNSAQQNETGGNHVELPPPYSEAPQVRVENPAVIHNAAVQQQNVWPPQGGYPPFSYPGGNQQQPFQSYPPGQQHGGYFTYNPSAAPSQPGVLSQDELRRRQEAAIRQGIATTVVRRPTFGRRSCTYRLARLGIVLFILGLVLLILLGVLIVRPAHNDTQLKSSWCKVISSEMTGDDKSCDCGRYCSSSYPCLEIQVSYDANGEQHTAYLYQDVYADKNQCSIQPCDTFEGNNEDDVNNFKNEYGRVDSEYRCYYNPKTPDEAFQERSSVKSDEMKILHCILWPMLLIAISVGLLGTLLCRSKGFFCFKKNNGSSVPYQNMQPTA